MNKWDNFIHNVKDISSFKDPVTGEVFFGDYDKLLTGIDKGACFGLTMMWVQAVLCKTHETDKFYRRLDLLTNNPDIGWYTGKFRDKHFKSLAEAIYYTRQIVKYTRQTPPELEIYLEIPALLDGITLYQDPSTSYHFTGLAAQNSVKSSPFTLPDSLSIEEIKDLHGHINIYHRPLTMIYNQTWTPSCITRILRLLLNHILEIIRDTGIPFAIVVTANTCADPNSNLNKELHSIGIRIAENNLTIFDQNYMKENLHYLNMQSLSNKVFYLLDQIMFKSLPIDLKNNIFNVEIYLAPKDNNIFFQSAKNELINKLTEYIHGPRWYQIFATHPENTERAQNAITTIKGMKSYHDIAGFIDKELRSFRPVRSLAPHLSQDDYSSHEANNKIEKYYKLLTEFYTPVHNCLLKTNTDYEASYKEMTTPYFEYGSALHTLLYFAVRFSNFNLVYDLLRSGLNPDFYDGDRKTLLHYAVGYGDKNIIKLLLAYNANINVRDIDGYTPLLIAVEQNDIYTVKLLFSLGANVHLQNNLGWTPLSHARQMQYADIIEVLSGHLY